MRGDCTARSNCGHGGPGGEPALIGELALAQAIVDIATQHARGRTVAAIELRVGRERELAPEGLDFAFSLLSEGTPLDGAALEIEQVPGGELALDALRLHAGSRL